LENFLVENITQIHGVTRRASTEKLSKLQRLKIQKRKREVIEQARLEVRKKKLQIV
jgi:hypothetical protein